MDILTGGILFAWGLVAGVWIGLGVAQRWPRIVNLGKNDVRKD
jgi:hypothetical protein